MKKLKPVLRQCLLSLPTVYYILILLYVGQLHDNVVDMLLCTAAWKWTCASSKR